MTQAKTLTAAELRRANDYIATRPHAARNRAMLLTTHLAGLRVGEVALLSWSDAVDANGLVREEIRLNADQTKGRHPRTVYVSPKLRKELQIYVNSIPARAPEAAFFYTQKHPRRSCRGFQDGAERPAGCSYSGFLSARFLLRPWRPRLPFDSDPVLGGDIVGVQPGQHLLYLLPLLHVAAGRDQQGVWGVDHR